MSENTVPQVKIAARVGLAREIGSDWKTMASGGAPTEVMVAMMPETVPIARRLRGR